MDVDITLEFVLYLIATLLLGFAAFGYRRFGRLDLVLAAVTILVFTFFLLPLF